MKKECFTCSNKLSTELTQEQRKQMKEEATARGEKWPRIPEMIFHCKVTGNRISQINPACEHYSDDADLVDIRKMIAKTATKLRKENVGHKTSSGIGSSTLSTTTNLINCTALTYTT